MKYLSLICLTLFLLFNAGCVKQPPNAVQSFKTCKALCQIKAQRCQANCRDNCKQCQVCAEKHALKSYHHYRHEQFVRGAIFARDLKSFRDPLQCRKMTCNCPKDYEICLQSCKGCIHKRIQSPIICC